MHISYENYDNDNSNGMLNDVKFNTTKSQL